MRGQKTVVGRDADLHAAAGVAGEMAVQISVQNKHVRLVEGDEPMQGGLFMKHDQPLVDMGDGEGDEALEERGRFVIQPGVHPEPGRMGEMLEGEDGFQTRLPARGDDVGVMIEGGKVEVRRGGALRAGGRLDPRPFDAETEGGETNSAAAGEVLLVPMPEIGGLPGAHDAVLRFRFGPVVLRLAGAIVTALALIAGAGNAPQKVIGHGSMVIGREIAWHKQMTNDH